MGVVDFLRKLGSAAWRGLSRLALVDWIMEAFDVTWTDVGNFLVDVLNGIGERAVDSHERHQARMAAKCVERVNRGETTMSYCFRRYGAELRRAGLTEEALEVWRRTA